MVILPLMCKSCGKRVDITSDQGMPRCPDCSGKMGPVPGGRAKPVESVSQVMAPAIIALTEEQLLEYGTVITVGFHTADKKE